jgi:hypothetical protein
MGWVLFWVKLSQTDLVTLIIAIFLLLLVLWTALARSAWEKLGLCGPLTIKTPPHHRTTFTVADYKLQYKK